MFLLLLLQLTHQSDALSAPKRIEFIDWLMVLAEIVMVVANARLLTAGLHRAEHKRLVECWKAARLDRVHRLFIFTVRLMIVLSVFNLRFYGSTWCSISCHGESFLTG